MAVNHSEESVRALLKRQLEPHGWRVGGPVAAENSSGGGESFALSAIDEGFRCNNPQLREYYGPLA